jgi:hypothetical protein
LRLPTRPQIVDRVAFDRDHRDEIDADIVAEEKYAAEIEVYRPDCCKNML